MGPCLGEAEAEAGFQQWGAPPSQHAPPSCHPSPAPCQAHSATLLPPHPGPQQLCPVWAHTGHCGRAHFQELKVVPITVPRPGPAPAPTPRSTPMSQQPRQPIAPPGSLPSVVSSRAAGGEYTGLSGMTVAESPLPRPVSPERRRGCCRQLAFLQLVSRPALR